MSAQGTNLATVAIVEDDAGVRTGWVKILNRMSGYKCIGDFGSGEEALEQLPKNPPDFVFMDINLPGISGVECTRKLKMLLPEVEVLMLTMFDDRDRIFEALRAGACGYLLKRTTPQALKTALEEAAIGGAPMSPPIARQVVQFFRKAKPISGPKTGDFEPLSRQESETLRLLAEGCQYKEIAEKLGISVLKLR
jgi:DNA-binding NarL/FixJ family response regulator